MSPPRLTVVSSHAQLGGSERYLEQLLPEVADLLVDLVALEDGPFVARSAAGPRPAAVLRTGAGLPSLLCSALRLRRRLRRSRTSVVHANGVKAALVAVLATRAGGPPVLWLKHDFSWDGRLGTWIARRCARVVGVSRAVVGALPPDRRDVVLTGLLPAPEVPAAQARALLREAGALPPHAQVALLVGRLHPVKGHLDAFAAVERAASSVPALHLVVVGDDDPHQPEHAARVRAHAQQERLRGRVILLGPREDVRLLLAGADVLLAPSVVDERGMGREGFGLVPVEALAAGTPVVGYADGALPEVLGACAVLVPPGDRAALADALVRVLNDPQLASALAGSGRERFRELFGFARMVAELRTRYAATTGAG